MLFGSLLALLMIMRMISFDLPWVDSRCSMYLAISSIGWRATPLLHGGLGYRRGYMQQYARIERFRDDVVAPEGKLDVAVGLADGVGAFFAGQLCQRLDGGQLHLFVDAGGATIEGTTEDKREAEDVVDLVGVVGAPGGDHHVAAYRMGVFRGDFRIGVGHGEDDRVRSHAGDHLFGKGSFDGKAEQDVGSLGSFLQSTEVGVGGEEFFVGVHPLDASLVDDPLGVAHDHVVRLDPKRNRQFGAGVGGCAGSVDDDADVLDLLVNQVQGVQQSGGGDDGGAVLVVVENRESSWFS